jgi:glycerol uptake facilitator-like aquaporin
MVNGMSDALFEPLTLLLLVLGTVIHVVGTLAEESKRAGQRVTIKQYSDEHPYQMALGLGLSLSAYFLMDMAGQLNPAMAFACGYTGDSIIKKFTNSTEIGKRK